MGTGEELKRNHGLQKSGSCSALCLPLRREVLSSVEMGLRCRLETVTFEAGELGSVK